MSIFSTGDTGSLRSNRRPAPISNSSLNNKSDAACELTSSSFDALRQESVDQVRRRVTADDCVDGLRDASGSTNGAICDYRPRDQERL